MRHVATVSNHIQNWSKQHSHNFGRSHDELRKASRTTTPKVCDARSLLMIDCRKLDGADRGKEAEIHVGRNSRIMTSIFGSNDHHELHNHRYVGISRFLSAKNVLIMICEGGRRSSVANAELWSSTLSRCGRCVHIRLTDTLVRTRFWEGQRRWKMPGVYQTVCQNCFKNHNDCVHAECSRLAAATRASDSALEASA